MSSDGDRWDPWLSCLVVSVAAVALWGVIIGGTWLLARALVELLR